VDTSAKSRVKADKDAISGDIAIVLYPAFLKYEIKVVTLEFNFNRFPPLLP